MHIFGLCPYRCRAHSAHCGAKARRRTAPYPSGSAAPRGRVTSGPLLVPSRDQGRCRPGRASATVSSCSALTECALSTASQYGQAAAIPPASGRYCSLLVRGLTQMIRCATRESRCISRRSTAGRLGQPDREELARVVPLVEGLGGGQALVALQPDQRRVQDGGERLGRLGLAPRRARLRAG
jgi:hypothetical protein